MKRIVPFSCRMSVVGLPLALALAWVGGLAGSTGTSSNVASPELGAAAEFGFLPAGGPAGLGEGGATTAPVRALVTAPAPSPFAIETLPFRSAFNNLQAIECILIR